jgi:hypothetical protein
MFSPSSQDPRDAIGQASRALRGLQILLSDRPFVVAGDAELPNLVGLIADRLEPAAHEIRDYVPRDWTPPDD